MSSTGTAIGLILTLLLLLKKRRKKKQTKVKANDVQTYDEQAYDIRNYVPIEPESIGVGEGAVETYHKAKKIQAIVVGVSLLGAIGYMFVTENISRWIIVGTAALMLVLLLIRKQLKREEDPIFKRTTEFDFDDWED